MGGINVGLFMLFGYLSMALLLGVFIRSQFKVFQKYLIPGCIIAGLIMLIIGPGLLNIVSIPTGGEVDFIVFNLITVIFVIIGLKGFRIEKNRENEILKNTAIITNVLSIQLVIGILFTLLVVSLINPDLFPGFGSMLMLGQGFDPTISKYFGGFWEQELGFTGGQGIAFAFSAMGFLMAYILGVGFIVWAKKKELIAPIPGEDRASIQTGIVQPDEEKKPAGFLTTHNQAIETFSIHLAIIGLAILILYALLRFVVVVMVHNLSSGMVIVTEMLIGFNYLFALAIGLAMRRLLIWLKIDYIIDRDILDRILGVAVDYMVVAAIASIPLVVSTSNLWEMLILSLLGAGLTLFTLRTLMVKAYREENVGKQVALYGFLTGNISSSVALLRVLDPNLEDPFIGDLTYAGGLSFIAALPLFFFMNIPLTNQIGHMLTAAGLAALYGGVIFCAWYFLVFKKGSARKQELNNKDD